MRILIPIHPWPLPFDLRFCFDSLSALGECCFRNIDNFFIHQESLNPSNAHWKRLLCLIKCPCHLHFIVDVTHFVLFSFNLITWLQFFSFGELCFECINWVQTDNTDSALHTKLSIKLSTILIQPPITVHVKHLPRTRNVLHRDPIRDSLPRRGYTVLRSCPPQRHLPPWDLLLGRQQPDVQLARVIL